MDQRNLLFWHEVARIQTPSPETVWEMAALAIGLGGAVGELWVQTACCCYPRAYPVRRLETLPNGKSLSNQTPTKKPSPSHPLRLHSPKRLHLGSALKQSSKLKNSSRLNTSSSPGPQTQRSQSQNQVKPITRETSQSESI